MTGSLDGKRILIVEDEYFIAADLKREVARHGAAVVGPFADVARAMAAAGGDPLEAAVLDVNLEGAMSYAVADRLRARGIPFLFLTGYDAWALPDAYRSAPRVTKPYAMNKVIACISEIVVGEMVA